MVKLPPELSEKHLRRAFGKGDVLLWESFKGKETTKDSYFLLLSCCRNDKFLMARATKQVHLYGHSAKRLAHEYIFIKAGVVSFFSKDTVIDLTWMQIVTISQMSKLLGSGIRRVGRLTPDLMIQLNDYIRMATTITGVNKEWILTSSNDSPIED
ncbi:MAG: hypothetical protein HYT39_03805 [Candidatus Sungbacteria bacterium]|nr:hypothetical protein [Candidatus Sungbacteria bacterium]